MTGHRLSETLFLALWLLGELVVGVFSDWSQIPTMPKLYGSSQCYPIPPNMTLCQNVGYNQMILPNFLQHEDVKEAIHQSNIWVALVNTNCHPDLKRFLCSLYAPVCLKGHHEEKIQPCYQLCQDVKKSCLPRMMSFGFKWPPIVQCEQFPRQSNMCIPLTARQNKQCPPCELTATYESIASSFCLSHVVVKTKIKKTTDLPGGTSAEIQLGRKIRYFKDKDLTSEEKNSGLKVTVPCSCALLKQGPVKKGRWLLMATRSAQSRSFELSYLVRWDKRNPSFRTASRAMRRNKNLCKPQSLPMGDVVTSPRTSLRPDSRKSDEETMRRKKRKERRRKRKDGQNRKPNKKKRDNKKKNDKKRRRKNRKNKNKNLTEEEKREKRRKRRERRKRRKEREERRRNKTTTPGSSFRLLNLII